VSVEAGVPALMKVRCGARLASVVIGEPHSGQKTAMMAGSADAE